MSLEDGLETLHGTVVVENVEVLEAVANGRIKIERVGGLRAGERREQDRPERAENAGFEGCLHVSLPAQSAE